MCVMTLSFMCYDSLVCVGWQALGGMAGSTYTLRELVIRSYVCHDSFLRVP